MKQIDKHIISYIRRHLSLIENDKDFFELLEYLYLHIIDNTGCIYFRDFLRLKNEPSVELYTTFTLRKKSGKKRVIHVPEKLLKEIQQCLNVILGTYYKSRANVIGFIPGRSILCGAKKHVNKKFVYNIDLKDFFDYVDCSRVKIALAKLFNWSNEEYYLPFYFAHLCCCDKLVTHLNMHGKVILISKRVLPQGAPTSPMLTNIVCQEMDNQLIVLAKKYKAVYTRYADDITFSCNTNIFDKNGSFCKELRQIIQRDNNFTINKSKTRLQTHSSRQEVTGVVVNKKTNIPKQYIKQIRMWLYLWENYGRERAQNLFINDYLKDRGHVKHADAKIENVLGGKLDFLKMIVGAESNCYQKISSRYAKLLLSYRMQKNGNEVSCEDPVNNAPH